jgi:hypothetical protein
VVAVAAGVVRHRLTPTPRWRPVTVLLVVDAHWADHASLDGPAFVARRVDGLGALLLPVCPRRPAAAGAGQ